MSTGPRHPWDRQHKRGEHNITRCHAQDFTTLPSRRFSSSCSSFSLGSSVSPSADSVLVTLRASFASPLQGFLFDTISLSSCVISAAVHVSSEKVNRLVSFTFINGTDRFRVLMFLRKTCSHDTGEKIGLSRL